MKRHARITAPQLLCVAALLATMMAAVSCARQGYPTGGPKDVLPPRVVATTPDNGSHDFYRQQFTITFNEYVVLKNASDNIIVSPPLKNKADYTVKGKSLLVTLHDTLLPNTTYLFQFKEALADFTEGNLLTSYEYAFSTGATLDSLMLEGTLRDARSGKPLAEAVSVAAYKEDSLGTRADTVALWRKPDYVTLSDREGRYAFHYMAAGRYRVVAFGDKNRNLRVDADEAVAWCDSATSATPRHDSLRQPLPLRLSTPAAQRQRITTSTMPEQGHIVVTTAAPLQHPSVEGTPSVWRLNTRRDSLTVWCLDGKADSATLIISDTLLQDTLHLRYQAPKGKGRRRNDSEKPSAPLMKALCQGSNAHYDDLRLAFRNPIAKTDDTLRVTVTHLKDSSMSHYSVTVDSTGLTARINATLTAGDEYSMLLPQGLFSDIYGTVSDSLSFRLKPKDYGTLTLHIDNRCAAPLVVEVLDSRDTVVQQMSTQSLGKPATLRFTHLAAGNYRLRAIVDSDNNGRWTPGDYRTGRHPETTILFDKTLALREKWEMEERWTIEQ